MKYALVIIVPLILAALPANAAGGFTALASYTRIPG
jgi:hypothetical protein